MIEMMEAISANHQTPRDSIGASLNGLRDEVAEIEERTKARLATAPGGVRRRGGTLAREFGRLEDLKTFRAEAQAEKHLKEETSELRDIADRVKRTLDVDAEIGSSGSRASGHVSSNGADVSVHVTVPPR
jgi:hypothetical protein